MFARPDLSAKLPKAACSTINLVINAIYTQTNKCLLEHTQIPDGLLPLQNLQKVLIMKPLLWFSIASFSNKGSIVLVKGETKVSLDKLGMWGVWISKKKFNEQKVSTLDNNKDFINLRFLQKMNCQKTKWDQARSFSLV